jgi:hypothetical protein
LAVDVSTNSKRSLKQKEDGIIAKNTDGLGRKPLEIFEIKLYWGVTREPLGLGALIQNTFEADGHCRFEVDNVSQNRSR